MGSLILVAAFYVNGWADGITFDPHISRHTTNAAVHFSSILLYAHLLSWPRVGKEAIKR